MVRGALQKTQGGRIDPPPCQGEGYNCRTRQAAAVGPVPTPLSSGLCHQVTARRHRHPPEPQAELDHTVRAFLDHVITLTVSPPPLVAPSEAAPADGGHVTAPLLPAAATRSSLYVDAARERAQLTTAQRRREEEAAVTIQSTWRGYAARTQALHDRGHQKPMAAGEFSFHG